ncbi:MAG: NAD-binding protein [Acidobacteriaceae bacterium]
MAHINNHLKVIDMKAIRNSELYEHTEASATTRPMVLIVGGGFAGLRIALALAGMRVDVTLIDRSNRHTFQPCFIKWLWPTILLVWTISGGYDLSTTDKEDGVDYNYPMKVVP